MTLAARVGRRAHRMRQLSRAFVRIGFIDDLNYPLSFAVSALGDSIPLVACYFIARLVSSNQASIGGDYFTFAAIGFLAIGLLRGGLDDFREWLIRTMAQGQLEMYLVEPMRWFLLPAAAVQWLFLRRLISGSLLVILALALGVNIRVGGLLMAVVILALGFIAAATIGTVGASVGILSKRGDPVLLVYSLVVTLISGTLFPVDLLPRGLRALAWLTPHLYVISGLRHELMITRTGLGGPTAGQAIAFLLLFDVIGGTAAVALFTRALEAGRRLGVLGGY